MPERSFGWLRPCLALLFALLSCSERQSQPQPRLVLPQEPNGDRERGVALVAKFECNRCHVTLGMTSPPAEKDCSGCHRAIRQGNFDAFIRPAKIPAEIDDWQQHIQHLLDVPSLVGLAPRLRRSWLARFLLAPVDLRPALEETMPRFALSPEQAQDIAAYLAPDDTRQGYDGAGDLERGRRLLDTKGCGFCHRMSGVSALRVSPLPLTMDPERLRTAQLLAPDLRYARERLLWSVVERWLARPSQVTTTALMPDIPLSAQEVRDIASYVMRAPLAPLPPPPVALRLPLLERAVSWSEVSEKVFRRSCWHCHSEAESRLGDGGPGNTGGFGFRGRGINLAAHEQMLAGYLDDAGERRSLFQPEQANGDGRLLRSLLARRVEEGGELVSGVRGMPLGLPSLSPEQIQLIESYLAQGEPD